MTSELPLPPLAMREAVGPTDPSYFDNPSGEPVFEPVPLPAYDSVFDFGCGCGRLARQLIQQTPRPREYLGVDLHEPVVRWAQENLAPQAPGFEFRHHDVRYEAWNPGDEKPETAPFPSGDDSRTLVIAYSVFTHLTQEHAEYYLAEVARVLRPEGVFFSTWFLFDKREFPMMQDFQNALYINLLNPANAVIFDREWLLEQGRRHGLALTWAEQPEARGFQWHLAMRPLAGGAEEIELPPDEAPIRAEGIRAAAVEPDLRR